MPIHYKRKIIFIHIPKTGGTSISRMLFGQQQYSERHLLGSMINMRNKPRRSSHCTLEEIKFFMHDDIGEYKIITCVRNPYDRIKSEYYFLKNNKVFHPVFGDMTKITFENFLYMLRENFNSLETKSANFWNDDYFIHFLPQIKFLQIKGKIQKDIQIFKFENFKEIETYFGQNVHLNNNKYSGREYKKKYNNEMKKIVEEIYKEDIEYFQYSF